MKNAQRGQKTYSEVRRMAKIGFNAKEISEKLGLPKHVVERYLRHKTGHPPTIPIGTRLKLPSKEKEG